MVGHCGGAPGAGAASAARHRSACRSEPGPVAGGQPLTARVSSRFPPSSVQCLVEKYTGAGPSRNNLKQCLGVMVVQQTGVYCGFIRFMDHMITSRPVWDRASRARARQPRLLGVVLASESVSRAVTTQAERADCRARARASD